MRELHFMEAYLRPWGMYRTIDADGGLGLPGMSAEQRAMSGGRVDRRLAEQQFELRFRQEARLDSFIRTQLSDDRKRALEVTYVEGRSERKAADKLGISRIQYQRLRDVTIMELYWRQGEWRIEEKKVSDTP